MRAKTRYTMRIAQSEGYGAPAGGQRSWALKEPDTDMVGAGHATDPEERRW